MAYYLCYHVFYQQYQQEFVSKTFLLYFLKNYIKYLLLAKISLNIICFVLKDISSINLYKIYQHLPNFFTYFLIICFWFIIGRYAYRSTNTLKTFLFIQSIKTNEANPLSTYGYYLINFKNQKKVLKYRLSIIKSYSLVPVFLLVANNLTSCSINNQTLQNFDIKATIDANSTNIILILIILFYLFLLVATLINYERTCYIISFLNQNIFEIQHPDIFTPRKPKYKKDRWQ